MGVQNNKATNKYYSGQGIVLMAERDENGSPLGFRNIGNVSELNISLEVTEFEHKESSTGQRATDLVLTTENQVNVTITAESQEAKNLAMALLGDSESVVSASVTDLLMRAKHGYTSITNHIKISNVSVDRVSDGNATFNTLTDGDAVTIDGTAYTARSASPDASLNEFLIGATDEESVDNLVALIGGKTGLTYEVRKNASTLARMDIFAVTPGVAGDSITLTESTTGTTIVVSGATLANGGPVTIDTDFQVNDDAGSIFIPEGSAIPDDTNIHIDYTYAAHDRVEAFVNPRTDRWLRFEGLNTADGNKPVVVDIFKFNAAPLNELALINDELGQMQIEGKAQLDSQRPAGESGFFRELLV